MKDSLPKYVKASTAVARRERYAGHLSLAQLPRLLQAAAADEGELQVELQFGRDAAAAPQLAGRVQGGVPLHCQRCLRPFDWPLDLSLDLRLVDSEAEEARLMQACEPYRVADDRLPLLELIEDEALLALPIAPRCPGCAQNAGL
jgi:uncharacterized protein